MERRGGDEKEKGRDLIGGSSRGENLLNEDLIGLGKAVGGRSGGSSRGRGERSGVESVLFGEERLSLGEQSSGESVGGARGAGRSRSRNGIPLRSRVDDLRSSSSQHGAV